MALVVNVSQTFPMCNMLYVNDDSFSNTSFYLFRCKCDHGLLLTSTSSCNLLQLKI